MPLIKLSNNGAIYTETFEYPDPDLIIKSVTRVEDIRYLSDDTGNGVVYSYADKDWQNNLTNYTGETSRDLPSRHSSTHKKSVWISTLKYPFITTISPLNKHWDTDTRRDIEALLVSRKKEFGLQVANAENSSWTKERRMRNEAYVQAVVEIFLAHELFNIGLLGVRNAMTHVYGLSVPPEQNMEFLNEKKLTSLSNSIKHPEPRIKITYTQGNTTAQGYKLSNGQVVLTFVQGLRDLTALGASPKYTAVAMRSKILHVDSYVDEQGVKCWKGESEPAAPSSWLAGVFGTPMANVWQVE